MERIKFDRRVANFRRRRVKYSIGASCIGGGQGIAMLYESVH